MRKRHDQQSLLDKKGSGQSFTFLDFVAKSTLLSIVLTLLPITVLIALWELKLTTPAILFGWAMFALFWTFYVLLKISQRLVE